MFFYLFLRLPPFGQLPHTLLIFLFFPCSKLYLGGLSVSNCVSKSIGCSCVSVFPLRVVFMFILRVLYFFTPPPLGQLPHTLPYFAVFSCFLGLIA